MTEKMLGVDHHLELFRMLQWLLLFNLAGVHYSVKQYEESFPLLMEAYTLNKGVYGPAHLFTLAAASGVEACLQKLDRFEDALEFGDEILEALLSSDQHGMNSSETLRQVEDQIGVLKHLLGRAPTAELQSSLERHEALRSEIIVNLEEGGG